MHKKTIYSEEHKKLIDLVTWLPFGYGAEYFYSFMICSLQKLTNLEIIELYPNKIKEQILDDLECIKLKGEEKKKTEVKKELSEKDRLLCSSVNMLCEIKSEKVQEYINIIIKDAFEEVRNGK